MTVVYLGNTFVVCAAFASFFQIALACGVPWGRLTWAGKYPKRLPGRVRIVAAFSAVLLIVFALVVEVRAGVVAAPWQTQSRCLIWLVVAYCALGVIANAITPSKWERILWLPVVLVLLFTSLRIATS